MNANMDLSKLEIVQLKSVIQETYRVQKDMQKLRRRAMQRMKRLCEKQGHDPYKRFSGTFCRVCGKGLREDD